MGDTATLDAGQQHLKALEHANRVRLARASIKRSISAGELPVANVVSECPWEVDGMSISDLVMSQKRWGRARCSRLLRSVGVPENKPVGTLTERQRDALVEVLESNATTQRREPRFAGAAAFSAA